MSDHVKRLGETESWLAKIWQDEVKVEENKGNDAGRKQRQYDGGGSGRERWQKFAVHFSSSDMRGCSVLEEEVKKCKPEYGYAPMLTIPSLR